MLKRGCLDGSEFAVFLVCNLLKPFVGAILAGNTEREVGKPAVGCCSVPVFDICGNMNYSAGQYLYRRLVLFLVPHGA